MAKKAKQKKGPLSLDDILTRLSQKPDSGVYLGQSLARHGYTTTGSLLLDNELKGGFVKGKIIECYGPESSGKTTLAYSFLAGAEEEDITAYIDGESSYDRDNAEMCGVDTSRLIVKKPAYIEDAMETVLDLVDAGVRYIVFDSIAGIAPKAELEGDMEDHSVGKKASRMGQLMRKLHLRADERESTVFFINQLRDSMSMYGSPVTTPGGKALRFQASYRLWIKGKTDIKVGTDTVGHYMKVFIKKNKFGAPNGLVNVPLIYGYGIAPEWEVLEEAFTRGIFKKAGAWVKYRDDTLCQGQFAAFEMLRDNPEFFEEVKTKIQETIA